MSFLEEFRIKRALGALLGAPSADSPQALRAAARLEELGPPVVPPLIEALSGERQAAAAAESVLARLAGPETLPLLRGGLLHASPLVVAATARVLSRPGRFDPHRLLDLFRDPRAPKATVVQILTHHARRLRAPRLLTLLEQIDGPTRPALLNLLESVADETMVPELSERLSADDPLVREGLVRVLGRFSSREVQATLVQRLLVDDHKEVRLAALDALLGLELPPPVGPLCQLLRDPDMMVQSKGIEALARLDRPEIVPFLIELLKDSSENVRRAAIEVLNEISSPGAMVALLTALRDQDWWVRVRAADALAAIGGPRVVDAILPLLTDEDPHLRQTAADILQKVKDERTLTFLVSALENDDAAIRARAAQALAVLGDRRAVDPLLDLLAQPAESSRAVIAALGVLGEPRVIPPLVERLEKAGPNTRPEIVRVLDHLTDEEHADLVLAALDRLRTHGEANDFQTLICSTVDKLERRFQRASRPPTPLDPTVIADSPDFVVDLSRGTDVSNTVIDALALRPGDVLADRYEMVRQVGRGGFGIVVLVEDRVVQEELILKFLAPQVAADELMISRFKHELRLARKITHENVIRIYDFITFGRTYAISMEYFPSLPLSVEMRSGQAFPTRRGLGILREVCAGLEVAHRAGVVHRDLKPANILIGDLGGVKLVDFGLAAGLSADTSRLTKSGLLVGTPTYMAPELVEGRDADSRSDIYSLGVVMYELFTGQVPYEGPNSLAILYQHFEGNLQAPRKINPEISEPLEALILKTMALDPAARYQSAEALRQALAALPEMEGV